MTYFRDHQVNEISCSRGELGLFCYSLLLRTQKGHEQHLRTLHIRTLLRIQLFCMLLMKGYETQTACNQLHVVNSGMCRDGNEVGYYGAWNVYCRQWINEL